MQVFFFLKIIDIGREVMYISWWRRGTTVHGLSYFGTAATM